MKESLMKEQRERFKEYPQEFQDRIHDIFEYSPGDPEYEEADEWLQNYREEHFNL